MKILAISPRMPSEGKKGDQVISFHRLAYLANSHQIQLICFSRSIDDKVAKEQLESLGIVVHEIDWNWFYTSMSMFFALFDSKIPFQCAWFQSPIFRSKVNHLLEQFEPDLVYSVMIRVLGNLTPYKQPLIIDMVDSMALNFSRRIENASGLSRVLFQVEFNRVAIYEHRIAQMANHSFVVSNVDRKVIDCKNVKAIPLGIDTNVFYPTPSDEKEPVIAFTGNMNYQPNIDAVLWFYENCWSDLLKRMPNVRLIIVGGSPAPAIMSLGKQKQILVTGRVDSLAKVLNSAWVSIAPMQSGSGMQFKVLEAMACSIPVVTTTLGLGDIQAVPGKDAILADKPRDFVDAIILMLQDSDMRKKIGANGMSYVQKNHSWDALNALFEEIMMKDTCHANC